MADASLLLGSACSHDTYRLPVRLQPEPRSSDSAFILWNALVLKQTDVFALFPSLSSRAIWLRFVHCALLMSLINDRVVVAIVEINAVILHHHVSVAVDVTMNLMNKICPYIMKKKNHCFTFYFLFTFTSASTVFRVTAADYVYQGRCMWVCGVAWYFVRTMIMLFHPSVSFRSWLMGPAHSVPSLQCFVVQCYYMYLQWVDSKNTLVPLFLSFHIADTLKTSRVYY